MRGEKEGDLRVREGERGGFGVGGSGRGPDGVEGRRGAGVGGGYSIGGGGGVRWWQAESRRPWSQQRAAEEDRWWDYEREIERVREREREKGREIKRGCGASGGGRGAGCGDHGDGWWEKTDGGVMREKERVRERERNRGRERGGVGSMVVGGEPAVATMMAREDRCWGYERERERVREREREKGRETEEGVGWSAAGGERAATGDGRILVVGL